MDFSLQFSVSHRVIELLANRNSIDIEQMLKVFSACRGMFLMRTDPHTRVCQYAKGLLISSSS